MKLTKTQKIAVEAKGKNILISGGAGTGKTRVLVERFLHFVVKGDALVTEILALTFTDKAANEMKRRVQERLDDLGMTRERQELEQAYISTIHSFATRILREHPLEAKVDPNFRVLEQIEADFLKEQALDSVCEELCVNGSETFTLLNRYGVERTRAGILKIFHTARNEGKTLGTFFQTQGTRHKTQEKQPSSSGLTRGSKEMDSRLRGNDKSKAFDQIPDTKYQIPDFESLDEPELANEWKQYAAIQDWDWATVEEYKAWMKTFSRKRKEGWAEAKQICKDYLGIKLMAFSGEWRDKFEAVASAFEDRYEMLKRERGFLDFDDLQIRVLALFKNENPVHQNIRRRYQQKFKQVMVDEFQDTNYLQLELVDLLRGEGNLFFVGDYKQSVYAFRGAEPRLFLEKEQEYEISDEHGYIKMLENFRTEGGTLDLINDFFTELWSEDEMPFDALIARKETLRQAQGGQDTHSTSSGQARDKAQEKELSSSGLTQGSNDQIPDTNDQIPSAEALVIEPQAGEKVDVLRMREADAIAERILDLEEEGSDFGKMVILFQTMTDIGIYEQALKKRAIPYYALSARGFYHQAEIRDMMNFLACLENPFLDIPLAATLRSPIVQVSDDSLFWLADHAKGKDKTTPLYEGLKEVEKIENISDEQKENLIRFRELLADLRLSKDRLRMSELLDFILSKTSYELSVLADTQGVRKYANLKKLMHIARESEKYGPVSLGDFIRTVKRLETQEARESEAQIEAEASGRVVRLMTVHRAKGLEFPIVFVADMGKSKQNVESKTFHAQVGSGYGLQVYNPKGNCWEKPFDWQKIEEALNEKETEERKRLFYVALTRTESRLIFSGAYKESKKPKESYSEMSSWMEWFMNTPSLHSRIEISRIKEVLPKKRKRAIAERQELGIIFENFEPRKLEELIPSKEEREVVRAECETILEVMREYQPEPGRVIDLPVSAFALFGRSPENYKRVYEIGYADSNFSEEREGSAPVESDASASDFGTRMHLVLERLNFKKPEERKEQIVNDCFKALGEKQITKAMEILNGFLATDTFKALQSAKTVQKEIPFVLNERHGLIHGVIDVLFQDKQDKWHVLDYKTAVGDEEKIKKSGYDLQIAIYAMAVRELLGVAVESGVLYFLKNNWESVMKMDETILEAQRKQIRSLQEEILEYSLTTH